MVELVYKSKLCRIYCGDCREVIKELPPGAFDLVLTDPVYSSGARRDAHKQARGTRSNAGMLRKMNDPGWFQSDTMTTWGFSWFLRGLAIDIRERLPENSNAYWFSDWRQSGTMQALLESAGFRVNHRLVWDKISFGMGNTFRNQHEDIHFASNGKPAERLRANLGTVLKHKAPHSSVRLSPTEKPVPLLQDLLSMQPFRRVFDPFMGSGSTLVAAALNGQKSIGCDIDPAMCKIARDRVRQLQLPDVKP